MSSPTNSDTAAINAKNLKVMPASLLKQFRATASMRCYDFLFVEDTMKKVDLWKKGYRLFHGNKDLNIISQVNLLVSVWTLLNYSLKFYYDMQSQHICFSVVVIYRYIRTD